MSASASSSSSSSSSAAIPSCLCIPSLVLARRMACAGCTCVTAPYGTPAPAGGAASAAAHCRFHRDD